MSDSTWPDAEDLIAAGMAYPETGFTAHPRYVETAEALGLVDVWETRGAPDFCQKRDQGWVCRSLPEPCPD